MQRKTYLWLVNIPLHLLLIFSIPFLQVNVNSILFFLLGYVLIHGLGVNVGLHRWASHKSIQVNTTAKWIMLFFSALACQGPISWWVRVHRLSHHAYSDTVKDIHSPIHGVWTSFMGWMYQGNKNALLKGCKSIMRDPAVKFYNNFCVYIIWCVWIICACININFLYFAVILPTVFALYAENTINTVCHLNFGYRNFETNDKSRNVPLLGLIGWGNGWHNNHHKHPSKFLFGNRRWEIDLCFIFIPFIKK